MSEWFRDYDELAMYARNYYEKSIPYNNISPSQVFARLRNKDSIVFIGFRNPPRTGFDSLITAYVDHFPNLKNTDFFTAKDSAAVLAKAKAAKGKPIVTFNIMGTGGGEIANWLVQNGIPNVNYLIGNLTGFYEYLVNYQMADKQETYFNVKNNIQFYSGLSLCRSLERKKPIQLIDLRPDTQFVKPTIGTKLTYNHIKGALNFPYYRSSADFEKQFPDKDKEYILLPHQGYVGMDLADALLSKGYKIGWLMGGNERFEWYANNVNLFTCRGFLE
jgi:rhodanese-related sulfurtransferase